MITDDERFIEIQAILAFSNVIPENCFKINDLIIELSKENKQLKDKLSKIETLIINHNCDTGDIYYKYNSRFLKSELKQRIIEILEDKEV